jgi:CRISPR-associated protein Cas5d
MRLKVWGDLALFTRPETKADPYSYPILTPSAAEGILKAIFWKPEITYSIEGITVLNPIRYQSLFRNMGQSKIAVSTVKTWATQNPSGRYLINEDRSQRNHVVLKNVAYIIDFSLHLTTKATEPIDKYHAICARRIERGQCFKQPCLGVREFPANFSFPDGNEQIHPELLGTFNFGQILKKMHFVQDPKGNVQWKDNESQKIVKGRVFPEFFEAIMRDGVVRC